MQDPNTGEYVMEKDWDNLIILDACRFDSFAAASPFDGELSKMESRGETTGRFIVENFKGRSYHDTLYICANAAVGSKRHLVDVFKFSGVWRQDTFENFDRMYREGIPTKSVTDECWRLLNEYPNKRLIAHFLPPHPPFVVKDGEALKKGNKYRDFTAARQGEVDQESVRKVYNENMEYILNKITDFVEDLDGKTVITSDHGELLGEGIRPAFQVLHPRWGIRHRQRFDYAHYDYVRHPILITVPWLELDYENRRKTIEGEPRGDTMNEEIIEDQLESLGYR
jgi:hypothetical protein